MIYRVDQHLLKMLKPICADQGRLPADPDLLYLKSISRLYPGNFKYSSIFLVLEKRIPKLVIEFL